MNYFIVFYTTLHLATLHWMPVRQRVLFKIAVLVFQCLAGQAPSYLSDDCQPVSDSRPCRLRSSDSLSCVVRRAHNTYDDRCFATAGPRVWNSLPAELQQCSSLRQFKRCLKTFLFRSWDYGALWLFVKQRRIEIVLLTYLLTYLPLLRWHTVCISISDFWPCNIAYIQCINASLQWFFIFCFENDFRLSVVAPFFQ